MVGGQEHLRNVLESQFRTDEAQLPPEFLKELPKDKRPKVCWTYYRTTYHQGPHQEPRPFHELILRRSVLPCVLFYRYGNGEWQICFETDKHCYVFATNAEEYYIDGVRNDGYASVELVSVYLHNLFNPKR